MCFFGAKRKLHSIRLLCRIWQIWLVTSEAPATTVFSGSRQAFSVAARPQFPACSSTQAGRFKSSSLGSPNNKAAITGGVCHSNPEAKKTLDTLVAAMPLQPTDRVVWSRFEETFGAVRQDLADFFFCSGWGDGSGDLIRPCRSLLLQR